MRNRLRQLRVAAGLTQTELAALTGLPLSTINRIDANPQAKVTLDQAAAIAGVLRLKTTTELLPLRR